MNGKNVMYGIKDGIKQKECNAMNRIKWKEFNVWNVMSRTKWKECNEWNTMNRI